MVSDAIWVLVALVIKFDSELRAQGLPVTQHHIHMLLGDAIALSKLTRATRHEEETRLY